LAPTLAYFGDYLAHGRTLGRANLFVYTLPTSAASEIAILLKLDGPLMHLHADAHPLRTLLDQAQLLITMREASGMLALWSQAKAAVCFAVSGQDQGAPGVLIDNLELGPAELAGQLEHRIAMERGS